ncbi:TIGR00645 family protein [Hafnia alvei]|uniref:TIGR00645 family protein n=1 Tax=Hafnia alvei TaxID=569 RepID=UPI00103437A2|nr:TIGR00645 family protein [Hafnia alvei]TBL89875.1 TIGR00645 family protein [Hafnia alvei]
MGKIFTRILFATRWVMAPVYLGLSAGLIILAYKFFIELYTIILNASHYNNEELILSLLSLVDFVLIGGLLVMVIFSGYENFVSRLNVKGADDELSWIGKMDVESLKNKVFISVVSISTIHLLGVFMESKNIPNDKILMYIGLQLCFVITALLMQVLENLSKKE